MKSRLEPLSAISSRPRRVVLSFAMFCSALAFTFMPATSTMATPLSIQILDAQYSTSAFAEVVSNGLMTPFSRTTVSASPFSDDLKITGLPYGGGESRAQAGFLSVEAYSAVFGGHGNSAATNQLSFAPANDQTLTLSLLFSSSSRYYYCSGSVDLFDLTANTEVWNYGWSGFEGTVPWGVASGGAGPSSAELDPITTFLSSHTYQLTMITGAGSASDTDEAMIQLQGLQAVPEPGLTSLVVVGLGGVFAFGRKRASPHCADGIGLGFSQGAAALRPPKVRQTSFTTPQ